MCCPCPNFKLHWLIRLVESSRAHAVSWKTIAYCERFYSSYFRGIITELLLIHCTLSQGFNEDVVGSTKKLFRPHLTQAAAWQTDKWIQFKICLATVYIVSYPEIGKYQARLISRAKLEIIIWNDLLVLFFVCYCCCCCLKRWKL